MATTVSTTAEQVAVRCLEKALLMLEGESVPTKETIKSVSDLVRIANEAKCSQGDIAFFPG